MEQLDLFGFPVEPAKPVKKKDPAVKAKAGVTPVPPAPEAIFTSQPPPETVVTIAEEEFIAVPEVVYQEQTVGGTEPISVIAEEAGEQEPVAESDVTGAEPTVVLADPEESETHTQPIPAIKPGTAVPSVKTSGKRGRKSFREMDSEVDLVDVPEDAVLQQKLYYPISEVAGWFKVNTSLLRFWENEFDILQPRKTRKGDRLFRVEDIKNLQLIYFLLRQRKFSIDGAKKYLKNNKKEADTQAQIVQSLTRFRSFLLELKTNVAS